MRAVWNGTVNAESDDTVVVDGKHYFSRDSINRSTCAIATRHPRARGRVMPSP